MLSICLVTFVLPQICFTQNRNGKMEKTKLSNIYISFGIPLLPNVGGGVGISAILSNNWGTSISLNALDKKAKNTPSNYNKVNCSTGYCRGPTDNITTISFRLIREFPTLASKLRYGLEGGFSHIKYKETIFQPYNNYQRNYSTSYVDKIVIGLSLRAKMKFPLTNVIGIEVAAMLNINQIRPFMAVEFRIQLGKVRERV